MYQRIQYEVGSTSGMCFLSPEDNLLIQQLPPLVTCRLQQHQMYSKLEQMLVKGGQSEEEI